MGSATSSQITADCRAVQYGVERNGYRLVVVFTSDHGYFYGEHGLSVERRLANEESIRIPLLIRCPPLIEPGARRSHIVLTLDFAPTLLDLAGIAVPEHLHGESLVPLFRDGTRESRGSFLIEYFSDPVFPRIRNMGYQAVRTERWKYIHYTELSGMDELYDLQSDPYEMKNLIGRPEPEPALKNMRGELRRLKEQYERREKSRNRGGT